jgi:predicted XRE-type DNA-binding protein
MGKRNIRAEIIEGFNALKAEREGKITLRKHAVESKPVRDKAAMNAKLKMTRGSGNVFQDVGFPPDEANILMLRAQLMTRVRDAARGASQREAAKRFGITQPRLNDVLRGRIDKFSLDALVTMLAHAGVRVELRVKKAAKRKRKAPDYRDGGNGGAPSPACLVPLS